MSTVPFILEALGAQGLILLWVRRDEKSLLLNQAPSSLLWTAARNIWVQNHTETVTKADARAMLTDALEEHSGLTTQKAHPSPLEFPSAPPFRCLTLYPGCWSQCLISDNCSAGGCPQPVPNSWNHHEDHLLAAQGTLQNTSHIHYQTLMFLENLLPSLLPWQKSCCLSTFQTPKGFAPVCRFTHTYTQWV